MGFKMICMMAAFLGSQAAWAHPGHEAAKTSKDFDSMKQLVGTWEGTNKMGDKEVPMTVVYKLTSGDTAISEDLFPGTPHEMLSVYHKEGDSVGMTHFCAMGNQPHMMLKKSDGKVMAFEMNKPVGVSSMKEPHMHAVTLTLVDPDTLKQEWVSYADGKQKEVAVFNFKKKK